MISKSRIIENEYFIINLHVLADKRLSANEKLLFSYVSNFWSNDKIVYASNSTLAETLGTSTKTINNALKSLKHYGYICTKYENLNGRRYRIIYKYKSNDALQKLFDEVYANIIKKGV